MEERKDNGSKADPLFFPDTILDECKNFEYSYGNVTELLVAPMGGAFRRLVYLDSVKIEQISISLF